MNIAIVGLGYVGLPLSLQFARSDTTVLGLDVDEAKVKAINEGRSYIKHIESAAIAKAVHSGRFSASTDFSRVKEMEAVIICVPTPLNKNREPDISYILNTGRSLAPHLRKGTLVVLESTTYPGTTDEDLRSVLEAGSGMKAGVGFSPGLFSGTGGPGQSREQGGGDSKGHRRLHTRLSGTRQSPLWPGHQNPGAGFVLPRRRSHQADREHLPQREYRPGQRIKSCLQRHGHRCLGSHRGGPDQTFWFHALLSRTGPGRALHSH